MFALQIPGIPGGPEVLVILLVLVVVFGLVGRWVYRDAKKQGSEWAWQWGVGVGVLFLFGFVPGLFGLVVYLLVVRR
ncbi:hypothetical protein [Halococcus sp. IIIV-5B]|uniref:hypothetical protein n=1 Tax=Halococcus sp. IIIV-5B TaxID=2321230 RepID=UPI000E757C17|nr:hypothetical protein [Halococcus sp. IIIV-5B]RJS98450.1 hypothetical protein D3261_16870 [Halococcus sp. IIIV-5B]